MPIQVQPSVCQGCPLSRLLYNLYLEPLCRDAINNITVQSFCFYGCEVKILSYAEDLALVFSNEPSMEKAMTFISDFSATSAAAVNKEKGCGSWWVMDSTDQIYGHCIVKEYEKE